MLELVEKIHLIELEQRLRRVPLFKPDAQGNPIFPYKNARIEFRHTHPDDVNPTTLYLLRHGLEQQRHLRNAFREHHDAGLNSIDTLRLSGAIVYRTEEGVRTMLPPIVEMQEEKVRYDNPHGDKVYPEPHLVNIPVINDGAHRMYLARQEKAIPLVCHISGVLSEYPFYAFPNHWDNVKIVDEVPAEKREKKLYKREDSYELYRNFDAVFEGCSKPRK